MAAAVGKSWKPTKIHKKIKLGKLCKELKKTTKLFKIFKPLFRKLFHGQEGQEHQALKQDDPQAFMTCVIKVDASKQGWQRAVLKLVRTCKGARFKMDQSGVVEVSGIADPNQLLKKIGQSNRVELHWFQFGQCSSNLFMPESKKNPPAQEKPSSNNNSYNNIAPYNYNSYPLYGNYGYHHQLPLERNYGYHHHQVPLERNYGYHHQPPLFKPYAPY